MRFFANIIMYLITHKFYVQCISEIAPALVAQLDVHPTGDQEVAGSTPAWSATFFRGV